MVPSSISVNTIRCAFWGLAPQLLYGLLSGKGALGTVQPPAIIVINSAHAIDAADNAKWVTMPVPAQALHCIIAVKAHT